jgi:hypothetical protein
VSKEVEVRGCQRYFDGAGKNSLAQVRGTFIHCWRIRNRP